MITVMRPRRPWTATAIPHLRERRLYLEQRSPSHPKALSPHSRRRGTAHSKISNCCPCRHQATPLPQQTKNHVKNAHFPGGTCRNGAKKLACLHKSTPSTVIPSARGTTSKNQEKPGSLFSSSLSLSPQPIVHLSSTAPQALWPPRMRRSSAGHQTENHQKMPEMKVNQSISECINSRPIRGKTSLCGVVSPKRLTAKIYKNYHAGVKPFAA